MLRGGGGDTVDQVAIQHYVADGNDTECESTEDVPKVPPAEVETIGPELEVVTVVGFESRRLQAGEEMADWQPREKAAEDFELAMEGRVVFGSASGERCAAEDLQWKGCDCDGCYVDVACGSRGIGDEGFGSKAAFSPNMAQHQHDDDVLGDEEAEEGRCAGSHGAHDVLC